MNDLVVARPQGADLPMTAQDVSAHVQLVQHVMRAVMKEGTHYGKIPGVNGDKQTLLKAGAEVLCLTFRIAPTFDVQDLSTGDAYRYRMVCRGVHQPTGQVLAQGVGSASSSEEKYKWRRAICEEEFNATADNRRRVKWAKSKNGSVYTVKQIRAEPDDIDNTVLKMAAKRAHIAMILAAVAASDIFDQADDVPETMRDEAGGDLEGDAITTPRSKSGRGPGGAPASGEASSEASTAPATDGALAHIRRLAAKAEISEAEILKHFALEKLDGLSVALANDVMSFIQNPAEHKPAVSAAAAAAPAAATATAATAAAQ